MLTGLIMLALGIWLIRHQQNKHQRRLEQEVALARERLELARSTVKFRKALADAQRAYERFGQLDKQVTQDALQREARAKAALAAILKAQGCNQKQIDDVISVVDSTEEGDWKL